MTTQLRPKSMRCQAALGEDAGAVEAAEFVADVGEVGDGKGEAAGGEFRADDVGEGDVGEAFGAQEIGHGVLARTEETGDADDHKRIRWEVLEKLGDHPGAAWGSIPPITIPPSVVSNSHCQIGELLSLDTALICRSNPLTVLTVHPRVFHVTAG